MRLAVITDRRQNDDRRRRHAKYDARCCCRLSLSLSVACQPLRALCPLPVSHYAHYVFNLSISSVFGFVVVVVVVVVCYLTNGMPSSWDAA